MRRSPTRLLHRLCPRAVLQASCPVHCPRAPARQRAHAVLLLFSQPGGIGGASAPFGGGFGAHPARPCRARAAPWRGAAVHADRGHKTDPPNGGVLSAGSQSANPSFGANNAPFGSLGGGLGGGALGGGALGGGALGGGMGFGGPGAAATAGWVAAPPGEERFVLSSGARGSISSLSWFATQPWLAVTTWDGDVQLLEVQVQQADVRAQKKASWPSPAPGQPAKQPLLCSACRDDTGGQSVALGGGDGKLRVWNLQAGAIQEWGAHQQSIKEVLALRTQDGWNGDGFATGSFDKTVALWTTPGSQPAVKIPLLFKVFAMDGMAPYLLVAGSDRHVSLYDMRKCQTAVWAEYSPLQWQTRCACLIPGKNSAQEPLGFALGGVDGSLGAVPFSNCSQARRLCVTSPPSSPGASRCAVNAVRRLPELPGKILAGGGDGRITGWTVDPSVQGVFWGEGGGQGLLCAHAWST